MVSTFAYGEGTAFETIVRKVFFVFLRRPENCGIAQDFVAYCDTNSCLILRNGILKLVKKSHGDIISIREDSVSNLCPVTGFIN